MPQRPAGTEGWSEERLAELVTRDAMIGTGLALRAGGGMNGPQDLGGQMGFGPVAPEIDEPLFHAEWEKRALGVTICCGCARRLDDRREPACARESLHPADYYASSYYEIWIKALETLLVRHGFVGDDELRAGQDAGRRAPRRGAC